MATATITLTLPTTRADGTPFAASDYGSAQVLKDGAVLTTLTAPNLVATDSLVVPGASVYTASISDTQTPPATSALSAPVTAPAAALAAPGAPSLSVTVA